MSKKKLSKLLALYLPYGGLERPEVLRNLAA